MMMRSKQPRCVVRAFALVESSRHDGCVCELYSLGNAAYRLVARMAFTAVQVQTKRRPSEIDQSSSCDSRLPSL